MRMSGRGYSTAAVKDEVLHFSTPCPNCAAPNADTCMKVVGMGRAHQFSCKNTASFSDIPHFKEVVLMNTLCEVCGIKSIECKTATGVAANGCRLTLSVEEKGALRLSCSANQNAQTIYHETCSSRTHVQCAYPSWMWRLVWPH
jgi:hypothetical protein